MEAKNILADINACTKEINIESKRMLAESKKALKIATQQEKQSRRLEIILDEFKQSREFTTVDYLPLNVRRLKLSPKSISLSQKAGIVVPMHKKNSRKTRNNY